MHLPMSRAISWLLILACGTVSTALASSRPALHVVMINGGGSAEENYASHLHHLRQMLELVRGAGVPPERVHVLASDGADPRPDLAMRDSEPDGFWLLEGTDEGERLRPRLTFESSALPGVTLQPATRPAVERAFTTIRPRLAPGDTLLVYVTDHGTGHPRDPLENRITLWGRRESLSARQLGVLLDRLDPRVRVVTLMSQCFSGGFAHLARAPRLGARVLGELGNRPGGGASPDRPGVSARTGGGLCGYFSSTSDRPAYGCYPESAGRERIGHSFEFMAALARTGRFDDAHADVLASDQTPDVPLRSSDVFLQDLLAREARAARRDVDALIDSLLREAWKDRASWEPEIRLLDRIGRSFGVASPRSLAEIRRQGDRLPKVKEELDSHGKDWDQALSFATRANVRRFLAARPAWARKLSQATSPATNPAPSRALLTDLVADLGAFVEEDGERRGRLEALSEKSATAGAVAYRLEVRIAVLMRLRTVLTTIAGRQHLTTHGRAEDRATFEALRSCEKLTLPVPGTGSREAPAPATPESEPFPDLQGDLQAVRAVLPGWMGIRFGRLLPARLQRLGIGEGSALVQGVLEGSPAEQAGLAMGDVVLGPPGRPFREENEIKAWTMLLPIARPQPLEVLRSGERLRVNLVPRERPVELPPMGGPPKVTQTAPPVIGSPYRGAPPTLLAAQGPFLLFFWATWCAPCKEAVPDLMTFAGRERVPLIAVTDEDRATLDAFFAGFRAPFPVNVLSDEDRLTFLAYGVSGTPTFVLVGEDRKIKSYATGYTRGRGLPIDGHR